MKYEFKSRNKNDYFVCQIKLLLKICRSTHVFFLNIAVAELYKRHKVSVTKFIFFFDKNRIKPKINLYLAIK